MIIFATDFGLTVSLTLFLSPPDFTQGMILPKKDSDTKNGEVNKVVKEPGVKLPVSSSTPDIKQLQIGVKVEMQSYSCKQNFKCPPSELYNVLTVPELMRAFTGSPAQVNSSVGGSFSLFDGQITGQFTELVSILKTEFKSVCLSLTLSLLRFLTRKLCNSGGLKAGRQVTTLK